MPVKRRRGKARMTPAQEADAWCDYFNCGAFLLAGTAEDLGLSDDGDHDEAARDAWHRLGALFLIEARQHGFGRSGSGHGRWALEKFGRPPCR